MKLFKKNHKYIISVVLCIVIVNENVSTVSFDPDAVMPGYKNKISHVAYGVGSYSQHAVTFAFEETPICMYTPLSYQDMLNSEKKTYFLPKTVAVGNQIRYFYHDLTQLLHELGIRLDIHEVTDIHYGLQMTFTMPSEKKYEIVKIVDSEKKLIHFNFVQKI